MVEFIIEMLLALPVLFLWLALVSLVVRPFGIQLPLKPFSAAKPRSAFQALNFSQFMIVGGVLYYGCGMWVVTTLWRYLERKYWHGSSITAENLVHDALQYPLLSGILFGVIGWLSFGNRAK